MYVRRLVISFRFISTSRQQGLFHSGSLHCVFNNRKGRKPVDALYFYAILFLKDHFLTNILCYSAPFRKFFPTCPSRFIRHSCINSEQVHTHMEDACVWIHVQNRVTRVSVPIIIHKDVVCDTCERYNGNVMMGFGSFLSHAIACLEELKSQRLIAPRGLPGPWTIFHSYLYYLYILLFHLKHDLHNVWKQRLRTYVPPTWM